MKRLRSVSFTPWTMDLCVAMVSFLRVCTHCGFIHYIRDIEVLDFMEQESHNGQ